jgi:hypothetical protein
VPSDDTLVVQLGALPETTLELELV